jgi:hypothetical protein
VEIGVVPDLEGRLYPVWLWRHECRAEAEVSKSLEFNFPRTRFVGENTAGEQLDHAMSEVDEIRDACLDPAQSFDRVVEEIVDLTHSLETYWRILIDIKGIAYVEGMFSRVAAKNWERGYYKGGE